MSLAWQKMEDSKKPRMCSSQKAFDNLYEQSQLPLCQTRVELNGLRNGHSNRQECRL